MALAAAVLMVGCGASDEEAQPDPTPSTSTTTTDPTATLRAEVARLEAELVKSNHDQQDLREQVRRLYVERASRSARPRPTTTPAVRGAGSDVWAALRQCESGGNYAANTGNGYYGAYQFSAATWRSMGTGYAYAHLAPPAVQDEAARRLQARSGWGQWPACSRKLGLR